MHGHTKDLGWRNRDFTVNSFCTSLRIQAWGLFLELSSLFLHQVYKAPGRQPSAEEMKGKEDPVLDVSHGLCCLLSALPGASHGSGRQGPCGLLPSGLAVLHRFPAFSPHPFCAPGQLTDVRSSTVGVPPGSRGSG